MTKRTVYLDEATAGAVEAERADTGESQKDCIRRLVAEAMGKGQRTGLMVRSEAEDFFLKAVPTDAE